MVKTRTLIIVRHAHRETEPDRDRDNGLSKVGQRQAEKIFKRFKKQFPDVEPCLLSSPKKRCCETLEPIRKQWGADIEIVDFLDEGGDLSQKAKTVRLWWEKKASALSVICSHGDLIPTLAKELVGARLDVKKGAWIRIEGSRGDSFLLELIQKP